MSINILHKNRNGCALHGALKVIEAVEGFTPIIHSSAGCSINSRLSENILAGSNDLNPRGWLESSDTVVIEKQVIFGGTSRLREQIKNSVKVEPADLYIVVTGCAPELVGDDVTAMVKEAQEQGFPVTSVSTPGFKGNVYQGYRWAVQSIVEYLSQFQISHDPDPQSVNVIGVTPNQDLFWEDNLHEIEKTLGLLSLKANRIFGFGQNIGSWRRIPNAILNLVVSPGGLHIARNLEEKFGTPYLYSGFLPTGAEDTSALLFEVGEKTGIGNEAVHNAVSSNEKWLLYQLRKLAQTYIRFDLQKEVALVGETSNVLGIARFLQRSFGQIIKMVIITDLPDETLHQQIIDILNKGASFPATFAFTSDGKEIDELLIRSKPEIILGSSLEESVSRQLSVPLLHISSPVFNQVFLNHSYFGYTGAVTLLQDFTSAIINHLSAKKVGEKFVVDRFG